MIMAYEYEKNVLAEIKELGARYKSPSIYVMAGEVEEVYRKAKVLDKVVNIVEDKEDFYSNEFIEAVVSAVDEFLEYELEDK